MGDALEHDEYRVDEPPEPCPLWWTPPARKCGREEGHDGECGPPESVERGPGRLFLQLEVDSQIGPDDLAEAVERLLRPRFDRGARVRKIWRAT